MPEIISFRAQALRCQHPEYYIRYNNTYIYISIMKNQMLQKF